jgi:ribonuclease HI
MTASDELLRKLAKPSSPIIAYTDGSCAVKTGDGGFGIVVARDGVEQTFYQGWTGTKTGRQELMGMITVLTLLRPYAPFRQVCVYCDSQYVVNTWNLWLENWAETNRLDEMANPDLLRRLLMNKPFHDTTRVMWVKGHAGNKYNEMADGLATQARLSTTKLIDNPLNLSEYLAKMRKVQLFHD